MGLASPSLSKSVITLVVALTMVACANQPQKPASPAEVQQVPNPDPLEGFNRKVHGFNMFFDHWLLKPAAKGYRWIAPQPVELGVSNFFTNLGEVSNTLNSALQWKWAEAGKSSGRFLLNSTLGLAGLFDVARPMGLDKADGEDFGQTLAAWGMGSGPYLVLPFLGPSTLRDTAARPVDYFSNPLNYVEDDAVRLGLNIADIIRLRADLLETEELASGDFYIFVRDAYLQRRNFLINDGIVEDDFGDDFDAEDFDF